MDLALSPQDEAFREEVRGFLDQNLTEDLREAGRKTADRKSTRLNSSHSQQSRMPSSA